MEEIHENTAKEPIFALKLEIQKHGETIGELKCYEKSCFIFGRQEDAVDYTLTHESISRRHAALVHCKNTGLPCLYDLQSANGTFVGNERIHNKRMLEEGDVIRFGESTRLYIVQGVQISLNKKAMTSFSSLPPSSVSSSASSPTSSSSSSSSSTSVIHAVGTKRPRLTKKKRYPDKSHVILRPHHKTTVSVAFDPSGTRMATGSMDHSVKLYNFGAMSSALNSYRTFEPDPGHVITSVQWNARGNKIAVSSGSSTPTVFTRDGQKVISCVKGDPYINNMKQTKGHVGIVTDLVWHPKDQASFLTGSIDGSVRVWHLDGKQTFGNLISNHVLKARNDRGIRVGVSSVAYSPSAATSSSSLIAATCENGSLLVWRSRESSYGRPDFTITDAHATPLADVGGSFGAGIRRQVGRKVGDVSMGTNADRPSCVCFSPDGLAIATRGGAQDNTVKLWDVRMLSSRKGPLKVFHNVHSCGPSSNVSFGEPGDGSLILVAAAANLTDNSSDKMYAKNNEKSSLTRANSGGLLYFRCKTSKSEPKHRTAFPDDCCPVVVNWHSSTQQIAVGCTDGSCRVFYDEDISSKGVMMLNMNASSSSTANSRVNKSDGYARISADSLIINGDQMNREARKKRQKIVHGPGTFDIGPERPDQDLKDIGKRGDQKSFTQTVMKYRTKNAIVNTDPRAAILKYHKPDSVSEWTGAAYAKTDPNHVLSETTLEKEDEEEIAEERKK